MSFHWNLSSDEEEETQEWRSKFLDNAQAKAKPAAAVTPLNSHKATAQHGVARVPTDNAQGLDFSEEDEEEEIDWEDADDVDAEDEDTKMPAKDTVPAKDTASLVPVTIDMNPPSTSPKTKKRKRSVSRKVYRFHSLPPNLQSLLLSIQQSHLLTLSSRAIQLSRCCSNHELLHVAHSLVPLTEHELDEVPTESEVREFVSWYMDLVNHVAQRRRRIRAANVAAGAPATRRSKKRKAPPRNVDRLGSVQPERLVQVSSFLSSANDEHPQLITEEMEPSNQDKTQLLVAMARSKGWRARYVTALDPIGCDLDVDHPLFLMRNVGNVFRVLSKGKGKSVSMDTKQPPAKKRGTASGDSEQGLELGWVEILCRPPSKKSRKSKSKQKQYRWMHVDPSRNLIDQPDAAEALFKTVVHGDKGARKATIAYALAVEHIPRESHGLLHSEGGEDLHQLRLTDVTPRYASSWSQSLHLRSPKTCRTDAATDNAWWTETLKTINRFYQYRGKDQSATKLKTSGASKQEAIEIEDSSDENGMDESDEAIDREEKAELLGSAANEAIPTSKAAFNNHPVYAIASVLNANEVFAPDAKSRICGIFKGAPVLLRSDVHTALAAKKWMYQGRKVKDDEIKNPVKRVKARKKPTPKGFQPLRSYGVGAGNDGSEEAQQRDIAKGSGLEEENDGMQNLYAIWQTLSWSPIPVGPNDPIPVNEYNNVELELLNPGLVHLVEPRISQVAKKLGIPYAPCLLGFEGHGGNRTPSIRGIVVHEHNTEMLREAHAEFMSSALEKEHESRTERIRKRWKKLIVGVLTKERLEREYGEGKT